MPHSRLAALTLVTAILVASGCGSSTQTATQTSTASQASTTQAQQTAASGPHLTSTQFIARADTICAHVNTKRATVTISSPQTTVTLLPPLVVYERTALAEMNKLTPPPALANDWKLILASIHELTDYTGELSSDMTANNTTAARVLLAKAGSVGPSATLTATAKRDGFKDCPMGA